MAAPWVGSGSEVMLSKILHPQHKLMWPTGPRKYHSMHNFQSWQCVGLSLRLTMPRTLHIQLHLDSHSRVFVLSFCKKQGLMNCWWNFSIRLVWFVSLARRITNSISSLLVPTCFWLSQHMATMCLSHGFHKQLYWLEINQMPLCTWLQETILWQTRDTWTETQKTSTQRLKKIGTKCLVTFH